MLNDATPMSSPARIISSAVSTAGIPFSSATCFSVLPMYGRAAALPLIRSSVLSPPRRRRLSRISTRIFSRVGWIGDAEPQRITTAGLRPSRQECRAQSRPACGPRILVGDHHMTLRPRLAHEPEHAVGNTPRHRRLTP